MRNITLARQSTGDAGTFGRWTVEAYGASPAWPCYTVELPWRDNKKEVSCIPSGTYPMVWQESPKFGWCYEIMDVPARTDILVHVANWGGDKLLKLKTDLLGCVGLGGAPAVMTPKPDKETGFVYAPQKGVTASGPTMKAFHALMNKEPATLTIIDIPGQEWRA